MSQLTRFFLGANSGRGFQSLYHQLKDPRQTDDLLILKGGPGVGKSSFMRKIGTAAQQQGLDVEYIHCSGDPDSLDAVLIPSLRFAAVDGTAPHVLEPDYPVAVDRYVDLGRFYSVEGIKPHREEIRHCADSYRAAYTAAYSALKAAETVRRQALQPAEKSLDLPRLLRRTEGICRRELGGKSGGEGRITERFLGGFTCRGKVLFLDSVSTLCPRIYELVDPFGYGDRMLRQLEQAAFSRGLQVIRCPRPEDMQSRQALLLPEKGVAFLCREKESRGPAPYRRIHLERMAAPEFYAQNRGSLRLADKLAAQLEEEAVKRLQKAKQQHDLLEQIYNPYVDFGGVYELAQREIRRLLG